VLTLIGGLLGALGLSGIVQNCPVDIHEGAWWELYRLLLSLLLGNTVLDTISVTIAMWILIQQIELQKGTMYTFTVYVLSVVLLNTALYVFILTLQEYPEWNSIMLTAASEDTSPTLLCMAGGQWPLVLTLITVQCILTPTQEKELMGCPVRIPTTVFPFVMGFLFMLYNGFDVVFVLALLVAACITLVLEKLLPQKWTAPLESVSWLSCVNRKVGFVRDPGLDSVCDWSPFLHWHEWVFPLSSNGNESNISIGIQDYNAAVAEDE
jgi:hypothetical protein